MKLIFELSGENPTLPAAELGCIGTIVDQRKQVAVADCPDPRAAQRLAMTHRVLEYLGECPQDLRSFEELLRDLAIETSRTFAGRAKKVHGGSHDLNTSSQKEFERMIGTMIRGPVSSGTRQPSTGQSCPGTGAISGRSSSRSSGDPLTRGTREDAISSTPG